MIPLNQNLAGLKRSQIRLYTNLAREIPDCAMLTIGEPDFATPDAIKAAAIAALDADMTHYAPNQGSPALRRAVADFETRRGHVVTENQVLITVGACQALFTALLGILNPGDEVIVPTPAFNLYESIAVIAGAKIVPLDISATNFQIHAAALEAAIEENQNAQEACGADFVKLQQLQEELTDLETKLEYKTERWMYLTELAEKIEAQRK